MHIALLGSLGACFDSRVIGLPTKSEKVSFVKEHKVFLAVLAGLSSHGRIVCNLISSFAFLGVGLS